MYKHRYLVIPLIGLQVYFMHDVWMQGEVSLRTEKEANETSFHPSAEKEKNNIHYNSPDRKSKPGLYICEGGNGNGYREMKKLMFGILPEYELHDLSQYGKPRRRGLPQIEDAKYLEADFTNEYDVFLATYHKAMVGCSIGVNNWLHTHYNGHFVFFSGESEKTHPVGGTRRVDRSRLHAFGPVMDSHKTDYDFWLTYMQMVWYDKFQDVLSPQVMVDATKRPRGSRSIGEPTDDGRPPNFMIYANGNCIPYREEAVGLISEFGVVHCDGRCTGRTPPSGNRSNLVKTNHNIGIGNWWENVELYSSYRFCFVMEHDYSHPSYITEKILMAFAGGCIPIYTGTKRIFDIFNKDAFVFYNADQPQKSLDQIKTLENDKLAYKAMMDAPIAAHGDDTINEFFSFDDTIGNGNLKKVLREKLGLSRVVP